MCVLSLKLIVSIIDTCSVWFMNGYSFNFFLFVVQYD